MDSAPTQFIFPAIESGALQAVHRLLVGDPGLVCVRNTAPDGDLETPL